MALYDDKRFILSHIRHSFITCDDTGMCETVMLNENSSRYPYEAIYHYPFDYHSDDDLYEADLSEGETENFKFSEDDINLFQETELDFKSELMDDQPSQSLDIMSDSYDISGTLRRRSNTAQRLEKLKKERKFQSKTKVVAWKSMAQVVAIDEDDTGIQMKRVILNPGQLSSEELNLLQYDEKENVYYETGDFRKKLFPVKDSENENHPKSGNEDECDKENTNSAKEVVHKSPRPRRKSALTLQLERCPSATINPFNEFTRFDGRVSDGNAHTKRIRIFFKVHENNPEFDMSHFTSRLPMSGLNCGSNWIEIVVLAMARVCDLIGLICWHYTHLQLGPPLKPELTMYALKIAEENGDVDNDFPSLTFNDEIKRYGFPYLALVEVETQIFVTIFIESEEVFSQIMINSPGTTLQEVVDQIKKKRSHLFHRHPHAEGEHLRLELRSRPGVSLNLKSRISEYVENTGGPSNVVFSLFFAAAQSEQIQSTLESGSDHCEKGSTLTRVKSDIFSGFRSNAITSVAQSHTDDTALLKRRPRDPHDLNSDIFDIMKAHQYQCFEVLVVSKLHNTPVEMGISETKVEITPKSSNSKSPSINFTDRFFSRFQQIKAMNIDVEDVVDCFVAPANKPILDKQQFKIVYWNGHDFKTIKFESDSTTVDDIVFKLQHVMRMRTSLRRNEYHMVKNRKKAISTKVYFRTKLSSGSSSSGDEDNAADDSTYSANHSEDAPSSKSMDFFRKRDSKFRRFKSHKNHAQ